MEALATAMMKVVAGDLSCFPEIRSASHRELLDAAATLSPLVLSTSALRRVLVGLRSGLFSPADTQSWASFVRRGYVSDNAAGNVHPVRIEYQTGDESQIVEIIGRLDEIGDQIDGEVDAQEIDEMLGTLG